MRRASKPVSTASCTSRSPATASRSRTISTYGYDVDRTTRADGGTTTTVRFSILRAPRFPDPDSDQGVHALRFRIRPAATIDDAVALGYDLRKPAAADPGPHAAGTARHLERPVGRHRDRQALGGRQRRPRGAPVRGARWSRIHDAGVRRDGDAIECTDLLERALPGTSSAEGSSITLPFRPFQLRTVRFCGAERPMTATLGRASSSGLAAPSRPLAAQPLDDRAPGIGSLPDRATRRDRRRGSSTCPGRGGSTGRRRPRRRRPGWRTPRSTTRPGARSPCRRAS